MLLPLTVDLMLKSPDTYENQGDIFMSLKTQTLSPLPSPREKVILTLPTNLMEAVREKAANDYNQFIVTAIDFYLDAMRARRARLIAGYQANADADAALAAEWAAIENESWLRHVPPYELAEESSDESN
jgi:hypothetical protein